MTYQANSKRQKRRNRRRYTPAPAGKPSRTSSGGAR